MDRSKRRNTMKRRNTLRFMCGSDVAALDDRIAVLNERIALLSTPGWATGNKLAGAQ